MKREYHLYENKVFINDGYVTFNIIELDRSVGKITVNINNTGHHTIDIFELKDLDGCTYFEYGRPIPEKIYLEDFKEISVLGEDMKNNQKIYIVEYKGVKCTAIFNCYTFSFYADDKYGRLN